MYSRSIIRRTFKIASLLFAVTAVTACSSLPETVTGVGNRHYGYAPEDPCIRCGESWVMLPNEEWAALKHPSNQKPIEYWEAKNEEMYGPNWRELVINWDKRPDWAKQE